MKVSHVWWAALAGIVFKDGVLMFRQDLMGLEKYVSYLEYHWVNLHWAAGFAVAIVGIFIFVCELREAEKQAAEYRRMRDRLIELGHSPEDYGL